MSSTSGAPNPSAALRCNAVPLESTFFACQTLGSRAGENSTGAAPATLSVSDDSATFAVARTVTSEPAGITGRPSRAFTVRAERFMYAGGAMVSASSVKAAGGRVVIVYQAGDGASPARKR